MLLGLAAAEILTSLGVIVRMRTAQTFELQSSLLASMTFLLICGAFIDAWRLRTDLHMDLISLFPAISVAVSYYVAAVVVLPREDRNLNDLAAYFIARKRFVAGALLVAELFYKVLLLPVFKDALADAPMEFWLWILPLNLAFVIGFVAIFFAKSRRANIIAMTLQLSLILTNYLPDNFVANAIRSSYGYSRLS